jgi:hypothetical protein
MVAAPVVGPEWLALAFGSATQHADDLGPASHDLTVRLHPVQVRMQQRLERAPITLDDRGMRA